eukprot:scaffold15529_cov56-Isochrysis_galbana.AAC.1
MITREPTEDDLSAKDRTDAFKLAGAIAGRIREGEDRRNSRGKAGQSLGASGKEGAVRIGQPEQLDQNRRAT